MGLSVQGGVSPREGGTKKKGGGDRGGPPLVLKRKTKVKELLKVRLGAFCWECIGWAGDSSMGFSIAVMGTRRKKEKGWGPRFFTIGFSVFCVMLHSADSGF